MASKKRDDMLEGLARRMAESAPDALTKYHGISQPSCRDMSTFQGMLAAQIVGQAFLHLHEDHSAEDARRWLEAFMSAVERNIRETSGAAIAIRMAMIDRKQ